MLGGDFNDTRYSWERSSSCEEVNRRAKKFDDWIDSTNLLEVEFSGSPHTWARGLTDETRKSARLDRTLYNNEWAMPWLTYEKLQEFMVDNWSNEAPLVPFLKSFSQKLQSWNQTVFHNIFKKKRELLARIGGVRSKLAQSRSSNLIKLESKMRKELDEVLYQEELLWYQKPRVDWLRDGDRNTSFFHLSTIKRRWRNHIVAIKDENNQWLENPVEFKKCIIDFF
ncbi:ELKS/Rab6-interacting/CAST family member 1 [Bienertia sinuspersici]